MKRTDKIRLAKLEYKYNKIEWISSLFIHTMIIASIIFSMTISVELSRAFNDYAITMNEDGYFFYCKPANQNIKNEVEWFEDNGFYEVTFSDDSSKGTIKIDSLEGIIIKKFKALLSGRDFWNEDIDNLIQINMFCSIIFLFISIILFVVMINSSSNSFLMKISEREKYIKMLISIGVARKECMSIYRYYFMFKECVAILLGVIINAVVMVGINRYIVESMHIQTYFSLFMPQICIFIIVVVLSVMSLSLGKMWRKKYEF